MENRLNDDIGGGTGGESNLGFSVAGEDLGGVEGKILKAHTREYVERKDRNRYLLPLFHLYTKFKASFANMKSY